MSSRPQHESGESGAPTELMPPYPHQPQADGTHEAADSGQPEETQPVPTVRPLAAHPGGTQEIQGTEGIQGTEDQGRSHSPTEADPSDPAAAFGWQQHYDDQYERQEMTTAVMPVLVDPVATPSRIRGLKPGLGRGQGKRRAKPRPGRSRTVMTAAGALGVGAVVALVAGFSGSDSSGRDGKAETPVSTGDHEPDTDRGAPFDTGEIPADASTAPTAPATPSAAPSSSAPTTPPTPTTTAPAAPATTGPATAPGPTSEATTTQPSSPSTTSGTGSHGRGHRWQG
jgi:hypothetical protein